MTDTDRRAITTIFWTGGFWGDPNKIVNRPNSNLNSLNAFDGLNLIASTCSRALKSFNLKVSIHQLQADHKQKTIRRDKHTMYRTSYQPEPFTQS